MLRIVTGRFRGRRLRSVPGREVRPTADRVKESIYNILQTEVAGARVLDLYAGSGNLGLEALSRGARAVVLVERAPAALGVLRQNLEALGVQDEVEVVRGDVLRYLAGGQASPFDIILADPPYDAGAEPELLRALPGTALRPGGWLVLQHSRRWLAPEVAGDLRQVRSKRFGDTVVDFFRREEEDHDTAGPPHGALPGDV